MIYPDNFEQKIGFDEIRTLVKGRCLSSLGTEKADEMSFSSDHAEVVLRLERVREFRRILDCEDEFPSEHFYDVRMSLLRIKPEGAYLEEPELFDLKRSLATICDVVRFFQRDKESDEAHYPALSSLCEDVCLFPQLVSAIDKVLGPFGRMRDEASPELARIRRDMELTTRGISHTLHDIVASAQQEGYVEKNVAPTFRDGRLVIPVAPALKRRIKGIVYDESATGKTVFVEPAAIVEANNHIRELKAEERREVIRILRVLSNEVRPYIQPIMSSYRFLGMVDFIRAKALLAESMGCIEPQVKPQPMVQWRAAVHPLLQRSLVRHGKKMVPLDITLLKDQRILIISGPNAGGKSVCLKTLGLLQYMLQCGMSIPLSETSEAGIFGSIFMDIGDEQSLENDLSTYSSHLLNMKTMMKRADAASLLLIDEFGGGTEPQIGGAMAEAMLRRFVLSGTFGVITTHYQNLKQCAERYEEVCNAAMLYDRGQMMPLFALQTGQPGSSFAIEIAHQIGIPQDVIDEASRIVGQDYIQSDKYLQDIVRDKRYWEQKREQIHRREKQLEQTVERYEREMLELKATRREVMEKARGEAEQLLSESNAKIENTIRAIREAQAEKEKTKEVREELKAFEKTLAEEGEDERIERKIAQLQRRKERREERRRERKETGVMTRPLDKSETEVPTKRDRAFAPGDYVRIIGQNAVGKLVELGEKTAMVLYGSMQVRVDAKKLEPAAAPKEIRVEGVPILNSETQDAIYKKRLHFKPEIDLRGLRGDEALQQVTYFIDDAILLGVSPVRILHGTGTGALRNLVRDYLATVPAVCSFRDEHIQLGGHGITVVEIG